MPKDERLGFALIGCGRIAERYLHLFRQNEIIGGRLICVCDIVRERAERFGSLARVPFYTDMDQMLAAHDKAIDIVCILTESGHHSDHSIRVSRYSKHVLVEKPMALRTRDAEAMISSCCAAGVRLFVMMQNRLNRPIQAVKHALDRGRFSDLVMGTIRVRWCRPQEYYDQDAWRGTWALDGGVFSNQACHHIDLLTWMLGRPRKVFATTRTASVNIEAEDTGAAIVKFESGAIGVLEATTAIRPKDAEASFSLIGRNGFVEISGIAVNMVRTWQFTEKTSLDELAIGTSEEPPNVYGFGHRRYIEQMIAAIRLGAEGGVEGSEAIESVRLTEAIYESAKFGREVAVGDFDTRETARLKCTTAAPR